jgi:hypothetical protein
MKKAPAAIARALVQLITLKYKFYGRPNTMSTKRKTSVTVITPS